MRAFGWIFGIFIEVWMALIGIIAYHLYENNYLLTVCVCVYVCMYVCMYIYIYIYIILYNIYILYVHTYQMPS